MCCLSSAHLNCKQWPVIVVLLVRSHSYLITNSIFLYQDSTLTPTNLWRALNAVRNWWGDLGLCDFLQVPDSVRSEIQQQTSDDTERKKMLLERWLRDHPTPSWAVVAQAIYQMREHDILEQVKKTYITGMLRYPSLCCGTVTMPQ